MLFIASVICHPWRMSFNPCCIGLDNDAIKGEIIAIFHDDVSILVVLDWTMMPVMTGHKRQRSICFNPCCIGLDNDAGVVDWDGWCSVLFQSLLYWIGQ